MENERCKFENREVVISIMVLHDDIGIIGYDRRTPEL